MRFVGMCLIIGAILAALAGVLNLVQTRSQGAENLIQGIIYLVIGILTYQAGGSFRKVVETHGTDIRYLMDALGSLRVLYRIQFWLVLIAIIFITASMILLIIAAMFKYGITTKPP